MRKNIDQAKIEIAQFYTNHKNEFIGKFKKTYPQISKDVLIDILQEAIVIGVEKIDQSKFEGKSSLKTYIFGIGKNLIREYFREENKKNEYSSHAKNVEEDSVSILAFEESTNVNSIRMKKAMGKLEKHCVDIIKAFYLEEKKYKEIVEEFDYANVDVAKSTKSRCVKHLKKLISNEIKI